MSRVPTLYRVIAIAAFAWNLTGIAMFHLQTSLDAAQIAALPPAQQAVYAAMPPWLDIVYAIAVFGGALGALGLLLRRRWAIPLFALSLAAVLVQMIAIYALTPAWEASGVSGLPMTLLIVGIAAFLLWYARLAAARDWLR
ncbi:hypothetical protein [Luteimonas kalidii]|uniref:Sugar transporter n=1 Tax=Luteimonas kalidii TaxID=3042025 RepID=A0ABT6JX73_9GAMM|nr:hypothetical protein [Luteimonas kalidii]MDH5835286.1 hypothetical protein [Luteimonas kalidii]